MTCDGLITLLSPTLAVANVPAELFGIVVVGCAVFASLFIIGMVTDSSLPPQTQGGRLVIGTLSLLWIGFWTYVSLNGGAFVGLLNLAPYFLLRTVKS
jgi:hypothetical protein